MNIGERVESLRKLHGAKRATLARAAGISPGTLLRAELHGGDLGWSTAEKVLTALGYQVLIIPRDANNLVASSPALEPVEASNL
jgi:transcriptional regulator with XRE-family HTH domain